MATQTWQTDADDVRVARELARRYMEIAASPIMAERRALWYAHNDLQECRPLTPYQKQIAEKFGLVYYGCCAPVAARWQYLYTVDAGPALAHGALGADVPRRDYASGVVAVHG